MIAVNSYTSDMQELVELFESEKVYYGKNPKPCGGVLPMVNRPDGRLDSIATADLAKFIAKAINQAHKEPQNDR